MLVLGRVNEGNIICQIEWGCYIAKKTSSGTDHRRNYPRRSHPEDDIVSYFYQFASRYCS